MRTMKERNRNTQSLLDFEDCVLKLENREGNGRNKRLLEYQLNELNKMKNGISRMERERADKIRKKMEERGNQMLSDMVKGRNIMKTISQSGGVVGQWMDKNVDDLNDEDCDQMIAM